MNQHEANRREWENPDNWSCGFYFSKKDTRVWVPKSLPWMGWTVNLGTRGGALWLIGILILLPLLPVVVMLLTVGGGGR